MSVLAGHIFWQQKPRRVVQFGFGPSCIIMWAFFLVLLKLSIFFVKSNAQILSNSMAGVVNTSGMRYFNEGIGFINKVTISEVKNYGQKIEKSPSKKTREIK